MDRKDAHFAKTSYKLLITNPVQVRSEDNLADGFTKSLKAPLFNKLFPMVSGMVPIADASKPKGSLDRMKRKPIKDDGSDALDAHIPSTAGQLLAQDAEFRITNLHHVNDS